MNIQKVNNAPQATPTFGAVILNSGSKDVIKSALKPEELLEVIELFNKRDKDFGDTVFWRKSICSEKLYAKVISTNQYISTRKYSQRFFESTMKFIKRVCKSAENIQTKSEAIGNFNPDELLKKY